MFAMARSSYEINAGLDLTQVLNRRLLKNLAKEIDAPPPPGFYLRIYGNIILHMYVCEMYIYMYSHIYVYKIILHIVL